MSIYLLKRRRVFTGWTLTVSGVWCGAGVAETLGAQNGLPVVAKIRKIGQSVE